MKVVGGKVCRQYNGRGVASFSLMILFPIIYPVAVCADVPILYASMPFSLRALSERFLDVAIVFFPLAQCIVPLSLIPPLF